MKPSLSNINQGKNIPRDTERLGIPGTCQDMNNTRDTLPLPRVQTKLKSSGRNQDPTRNNVPASSSCFQHFCTSRFRFLVVHFLDFLVIGKVTNLVILLLLGSGFDSHSSLNVDKNGYTI